MLYGFGARPTFNASDVYPSLFPSATPPNSQQFSGPTQTGGPQPTHVLLGILVVLVVIRVLYEVAA